jgi:hypothetical protein
VVWGSIPNPESYRLSEYFTISEQLRLVIHERRRKTKKGCKQRKQRMKRSKRSGGKGKVRKTRRNINGGYGEGERERERDRKKEIKGHDNGGKDG